MMQRGGEVVITMLPNVQQKTIAPLIEQTIAKGTVVYTNEYDIYDRYIKNSDSRKNLNTYKTRTYAYTISQRNHYLGTLQT